MNKIFFIATLSLGLIRILPAQTQKLDTGYQTEIHSISLNSKEKIWIYLPTNYSDEATAYPVLYVLDGQRFFYTAVGLHQTFQQFELTPPFIIVGLINEYPRRFGLFSDQA